MAIDNDKLADLLATTLKDLPKGDFEAMWDDQNYEFCRIYHEDRRKVDGGTSIQRNVMLDETGAASYRLPYQADDPVVNSVQHQIDVPWVQIGSNYSWDIIELKRNRTPKGYIELIHSRRLDGLWSFANLLETRGWLTPISATDKKNPYGIPYYLNMLDAGETAAGFNGQTIRYQDASTGTICAGIDSGSEAKWRNYGGTYQKVDNALLREMRKACLSTRFKPPRIVRAPGDDSKGSSVKIYCDLDRATELQDLADKRDDNNTSKDLAGKVLTEVDGAVYFNRMPVCYIPQLDGADYQPIYCVDWSKIQPIVQDGYWMEETKPQTDRGQHTTFTVFVDGSHNNLCINRRTAGWVLHQPIPA